jgi:hypothetical protein
MRVLEAVRRSAADAGRWVQIADDKGADEKGAENI